MEKRRGRRQRRKSSGGRRWSRGSKVTEKGGGEKEGGEKEGEEKRRGRKGGGKTVQSAYLQNVICRIMNKNDKTTNTNMIGNIRHHD